jgi:photosystem II stability/assembly factor-like uncharacterized protein
MTSALCLAGMAGCSGQADLSAVRAEADKPLKRYDVVQSLTSNEKVVVAGVQSGAVLVSSDGGRTWQRQALDNASMVGLTTCPDGTLLGIDFYKKVWHAGADGQQWTAIELEMPRVPLSVSCDQQGRWWVAGTRSQIAVSEDKGQSWRNVDLGEDTQITAIQFLDAQFGIATAEFGMVFVSEDGGHSWNRRPDMPDEFYPYDALYLSRDEGYVSGLAGQVLHTTDGGQTWQRQTNATGVPLYRLFMHHGLPYGVGAEGIVAHLEGDTWRNLAYPDPLPVFFAGGASVDGQSAVAAGGPGGQLRLIATTDR